jgi:hypothetical protein
MSHRRSHPTRRDIPTRALDPAADFERLVGAQELDAAQTLLSELQGEKLDDCIESIGEMMRGHGVQLPCWDQLTQDELERIARGAFYIEGGKPVLLADG